MGESQHIAVNRQSIMGDADDGRNAYAEQRTGVLYGVAAYTWWGFVPIYFKAVREVPAVEVLSHRIVWSVLLLGLLLRVRREWPAAIAAMRDRRIRRTLIATTTLLSCNWLTFIWAVVSNQVLQASLGYFITPLVNVLLGLVFLEERLRRPQMVAVALASVGVVFMATQGGRLPWIALALAVSFGLYGLLRKTAPVGAVAGLTVETILVSPLAVAYLGYHAWMGTDYLTAGDPTLSALLALGGVVTAVPLIWFANAARRLRLATIGFLQYLAPSFQFLLAVAVFGERFTATHALSFGCIWTALAIYSADALLGRRAR